MTRPLRPTDIWVAFSFAGEQRALVQQIAEGLEQKLGTGRVFYDAWYEAWLNGGQSLARLLDIYRSESAINVVCLSSDHQRKPWTTEERQAIVSRRMNFRAAHADTIPFDEELLLRVGTGVVKEFQDTSIYSPAENRPVTEIVQLIVDKICLARADLHEQILKHSHDPESGLASEDISALVSVFQNQPLGAISSAWLAGLLAQLNITVDALHWPQSALAAVNQAIRLLNELPLHRMLAFIASVAQKAAPSPLASALGAWLDSKLPKHGEAVRKARLDAPTLVADCDKATIAIKPRADRVQVVVKPDDLANPVTFAVHVAFRTGVEDWVVAGDVNQRVTDADQVGALMAKVYPEKRGEVDLPAAATFELVLPEELALSVAKRASIHTRGRTQPLIDWHPTVLRSYEWNYNRGNAWDDAPPLVKNKWQCIDHSVVCAQLDDCLDLGAPVSEHAVRGKSMVAAHGVFDGQAAQAHWSELAFHCVPVAIFIEHPTATATDLRDALRQLKPGVWSNWAQQQMHAGTSAFQGAANAVAVLFDNPEISLPQQLDGKKFVGPAQRSTP